MNMGHFSHTKYDDMQKTMGFFVQKVLDKNLENVLAASMKQFPKNISQTASKG